MLIFTHRDFDPSEEQFALEERREPAPEPSLRPLDGVEFDADAPVTLDASRPPTDGTPPVEPDAAAVADAAAVPENEFRFRVLRPEELQLTSQYRVLARLPAYHPLVHGGWVQLGLPESATIPVDLGVLGVTNPAGTVRLSLTRFLHVKLDLTYVDTQAVQRGPAAARRRSHGIADRAALSHRRRAHDAQRRDPLLRPSGVRRADQSHAREAGSGRDGRPRPAA